MYFTLQTVYAQNFVDENCFSFNQEEENNFEHARLHKLFCSIAENLLVEHLERVGITPEQFVKACESERKARTINQRVWSQICAIDDFLTFKKMMAKRNMELEMECIKSMRMNRVPTSENEERLQIQEAIRRSREDSSKFDEEDEKEAMRRSLLNSTTMSTHSSSSKLDDDNDGIKSVDEEESDKLFEIQAFDISRRLEIAELQEQMAQSLVLEASNTLSAPHPSRAASRKEISRRISKDNTEARRQVEAAFEKSAKLLSSSSEAVASIAQRAKIEVSERDIERRRRALLEQRKRLLAMKKKQRAEKLERAKRKEEECSDHKKRKKKKKKKKKKKMEESEDEEESSSSSSSRSKSSMSDADSKRREMRLALLERMKTDLRGDGIRARDSESKTSERSKISRQLRDFEKICNTHLDEEDEVVSRIRR